MKWALGELERVLNGTVLGLVPSRRDGGEWDPITQLAPRVRRRLIGARYMIDGGEQPDVLGSMIVSRVPGVETHDEAMAWYVRACLAAIEEARTEAHRRRHLRLARRHGYPTYYAYRTALVRAEGYGSVWDKRRRKRWH